MAWDTVSFRIHVSHGAAGLGITPLFAQFWGHPRGPGGKAELGGNEGLSGAMAVHKQVRKCQGGGNFPLPFLSSFGWCNN